MTCKFCTNLVVARGMCGKHYQRWKRTGNPKISQQGKRDKQPLDERLQNYTILNNGCFEWLGGINQYGYGKIKVNNRTFGVHRVIWWVTTGYWPKEELDHLCHTLDIDCKGGVGCRHRRCINPTHLEEVSKVENTRRRDARRRA